MSHTQASSASAPTMSAIAPGNHDVLMSELDMSAALHASDHPAKKQLSPKDAMQAPTNVLQSCHDATCHKRKLSKTTNGPF